MGDGVQDPQKEPLFRDVMGHYPTGVTVVTATDADGEPLGLTVNSFTSVSLEPPLVLVCIDRGSSSHDGLLEADHFGVSILSTDQHLLAHRFASEDPARRFQEVTWREGPRGSPILDEAVAWLECRVHEVHEGGDHSILLGRVTATGLESGDALVFYRGAYASVQP